MRAPAFWLRDGWLPRLLSPASCLVAAVTRRRVARTGWRAPVPVICCGNVTVGGAGKTTVALDLAERLTAQGRAVHVLLRGYGGSIQGPHRVGLGDSAEQVGDEALLLARVAPTWIGANRAASAKAAIATGAEVLLLDDGLQNPTLVKTLSLLVIDGNTGFGNGRVLPAGPLREPVSVGAARCQAAVLIGTDLTFALRQLPPGLPVLGARLVQGPQIEDLRGHNVVAFAGIASPDKFFMPLQDAGIRLVARVAFPDHHAFSRKELDSLVGQAKEFNALLATTPKDAVRLPPDIRDQVTVVGVRLAWDDPAALDGWLAEHSTRNRTGE